jgi:gamma-glutamyltranspeptidase/glutathione hydrolase
MFCLFYNAKTKKVQSLNGSGRSGASLDINQIRERLGIPDGKLGSIPIHNVHAVTVPGAAAGWVDCIEKFGSGKVSLEQILSPAIRLAEEGFLVSDITARSVCEPVSFC